MDEGVLYIAIVGALAAAYALGYLVLGVSLGRVFRQLGGPVAPAWIPVRRWVEVARVADASTVPVAIVRSLEALGLLAAVGAAGALASGLELPRSATVIPLAVALLACAVGWILWIGHAGWLGVRLQAPRGLVALAAFVPPLWGFFAAAASRREAAAAAAVSARAGAPARGTDRSDAHAPEPSQPEVRDEPSSTWDDATSATAEPSSQAEAEAHEPTAAVTAAPQAPPTQPNPRVPEPVRVPEILNPGVESADEEDTDAQSADVVAAGGPSPEPPSQPSPAPRAAVPFEPDPGEGQEETPVNNPFDPSRRSMWAPTGSGSQGPSSVPPAQPPVQPPAQPPLAPAAHAPEPQPPVVAPTQPVSPYATSPDTFSEPLPTAAMPTLSDRPTRLPDFSEKPQGAAPPPAWQSALDAGALQALLGGDGAEDGAPLDPTGDDDYDETRVSPRRREAWELVSSDGISYRLSSAVSVVGRIGGSPMGDGSARLDVADSTRTMSKTHARLVWIDGVWMVEDLESTNGTLLVDSHGRETVVPPGAPTPLIGKVLFGDFEMTLRRVGE
ncbi:FHA domain-containing protein [Demequina sp. NBRC 110054]|uniref:FHA domain-containing protein n=1 Tax=Demequina sp. NBRC 110054 TaxID=1570343 RepID=UPI000A068BFE|nr:FHA domain-containing protein [Demequina sp. NBRC 110054]